ncbi:MAG: hypothetical protein WA639_14135, partial [Candidatus Acidiferrum sp.]
MRQLETCHGTVVFLDKNGHMRHGRKTSRPRNVFISVEGETAHPVFRVADGTVHSIYLESGPTPGPAKLDQVSTAQQSFDLIRDDNGTVGLLYSGLLLCAEPDGRITLSRQALGVWERF